MSNFEPKHGSMEMWLVCVALGKNHKLIDEMQKNEDGTYPVVFSVGGVDKNANFFIKSPFKQGDKIIIPL